MKLGDRIKRCWLDHATSIFKKKGVHKYLLYVVWEDYSSNIFEFEDLASATGIKNQIEAKKMTIKMWLTEVYDTCSERLYVKDIC